jgi:hypothetical protein
MDPSCPPAADPALLTAIAAEIEAFVGEKRVNVTRCLMPKGDLYNYGIFAQVFENSVETRLIISEMVGPFRGNFERPVIGSLPEGAPTTPRAAHDIGHGLGVLTATRQIAENLLAAGAIDAVLFENVNNSIVAASLERHAYRNITPDHPHSNWRLTRPDLAAMNASLDFARCAGRQLAAGA